MSAKRFIIWDEKDGSPTLESSGLIGRVTEDNAYIRAYPNWITDRRASDLAIGEGALAEFRLSGGRGIYLVFRVEDLA